MTLSRASTLWNAIKLWITRRKNQELSGQLIFINVPINSVIIITAESREEKQPTENNFRIELVKRFCGAFHFHLRDENVKLWSVKNSTKDLFNFSGIQ